MYTDGITEAISETGVMFEEKRLLLASEEVLFADSARIIRRIKSQVLAFSDNARQSDDMALIAVKIRESK